MKLGLQDCLYLGNLDALKDWEYAEDFVEMQWRMLQQDTPQDYMVIAAAKVGGVDANQSYIVCGFYEGESCCSAEYYSSKFRAWGEWTNLFGWLVYIPKMFLVAH